MPAFPPLLAVPTELAQHDQDVINLLAANGWRASRVQPAAPGTYQPGLLALLSEARAVLRDVQWSDRYGRDADPCCPICKADQDVGHTHACRLGALLASL